MNSLCSPRLLSLSSSANLSSINLPGEPCSGDGSIPAQRLRTQQRGLQQDPHQPSTHRNQIRCRGCNQIEEQLWPAGATDSIISEEFYSVKLPNSSAHNRNEIFVMTRLFLI